MSDFYKRSYSLQVGGVLIERLRVRFKVTKALSKEPNKLECEVLNLNEKSRAALKGKGVPVILSAGYVDGSAIIFSGDSRTIDHVREGADWITRINCGDGERAYAFARFNISLPPGTSKSDVLRKAVKSLGLNVGNSDSLINDVKGVFNKGFSANTSSAGSIESLCKSLGLNWSIQDGAVQLHTENAPIGATIVRLTPASGLIGSPEMASPSDEKKPPYLKAKCFLNHRLRCGVAVELQSAAFPKGSRFRVEKCDHDGDTEGPQWYTTLDLKAL